VKVKSITIEIYGKDVMLTVEDARKLHHELVNLFAHETYISPIRSPFIITTDIDFTKGPTCTTANTSGYCETVPTGEDI